MSVSIDNAGIPQSGGDGDVTVSFTGDIAVIEMKRGENRINASFITKMNTALDTVERNENCKAVITTGSGKFYCNGLDLQWVMAVQQLKPSFSEEFTRRIRELVNRLLTFPMPTVAAINGHAFAAGAFLALAHDYRVMKSERGYWSVNEVLINLRIGPQMMAILRSKLTDPAVFSQALFNGKRFSAQQALDARIIMASFPGERLLEGAVSIATEAAGANGLDRHTLRTLKQDAHRDIIKLSRYATFDDLEAAKL